MTVRQLVYLEKDEVTVGRLPQCDICLESTRVPQMISRQHATFRRIQEPGEPEEWYIRDNKSLNGVTVNGEVVGEEGRKLQSGDEVVFGKKIANPEFEFIFEAPAAEPTVAGIAEDLFHEKVKQIEELQKELEAERQMKRAAAAAKRQASKNSLSVQELHKDLLCSICRDWMVHASTIECSHSFCWSCIDMWLQQKKFECPVCRKAVTREPLRTRAVDSIIQTSVARLPKDQQVEFQERASGADAAQEKKRKALQELEKSVKAAQKLGKTFFSIESNWAKANRETFIRGCKDYTGATRESYCKLVGLTEHWIHVADSSKLNQALHNLKLQAFVNCEELEIRQRLLMYLKYG